jgi:hypothetical protein
MTPMNGSVLKSITSGPPLDASKAPPIPPELVHRSAFALDTEAPLRMEDIARAFMEKREEQKEKLKKLAGLLQEAGDILNNLDA